MSEQGPQAEAAESSVRRRRTRNRKGKLTCLLGCLGCLFAISSMRLSSLWLVFDVFSHLIPHFAIGALAFLIGYAVPRARVLTAIVLVLSGVAAIGAWPHYVSAQSVALSPLQQGEKALRVVTFNTWGRNGDAMAVAREILRLDPDVVAIQELDKKKLRMLNWLKPVYPYRSDCVKLPYCHIAVLSKAPILDGEAKSNWAGPAMVRVRLGGEYSGVNVIAVHTTRPPWFRWQAKQIVALAELTETISGPLIVMGDFNASPFSRMTREFVALTGLNRLTVLPTWPGHVGLLPQIAIDHVFASNDIRNRGLARIGRHAGSDHFPVAADLAVTPR